MTDYEEEQSSELETLRCIYTSEELTELSEDPACFQVSISTENPDGSPVSVVVQFTYPPTYPDVPPETSVVSYSGLTEQHIEEVSTLMQEQALENVGMVMVFTLVSAVQEKLGEVVEALKEEIEREKERRADEEKRKEEAKYRGTTVTVESFMAWREKFEQETKEQVSSKSKDGSQQTQKLTGRQMFERDASLALSDTRFLTETSAVAEIGQQQAVEVDESLFQDLEDLELTESTQS